MKLILPVAGKGTRLRPHTWTRPKSLVRVAGQTVLKHVLNSFQGLDIEEYIVITDDNGHIIEDYITRHYPGIPLTCIPQSELLGPAYAVSLAAPRIKQGDDVLVVFNDTLFITDLGKIPELCEGLDGLIYSREVEDFQRFGVNVMKGNLIVDMVEKPEQPISRLAQVGLYYLRDARRFMEYISRAIEMDLKVRGEYYLPDVFKLMLEDGLRLGAPEVEEWLDCGKPDTLLATNRILLDRNKAVYPCESLKDCVIIPPVSIHPDADIRESVIGPHVTVSRNCVIRNSIIKNSIINPDTVLSNMILSGSLIGDSVHLAGQFQRLNIGDNSTIDLSGCGY